MNIEDRVKHLEIRVSKLEGLISSKHVSSGEPSNARDLDRLIAKQIEQIGVQDLVVIALKLKSKQTRAEVRTVLQNWGKSVGDWFSGGNLSSRMIKKGLVKKDGKNQDDEDLFSLTTKGQILGEEMIDDLK